MKTLALLLTASLLGFTHVRAAEPPKPLVTLTVKQKVLDSDHDLRGKRGSSARKIITLRVEIVNTGAAPLPDSELTGSALVSRAGEIKEKIVMESLGVVKVPAMKPNEKLTLDLGKIELSEVEWRNRKFEEKLEEWQVTCNHGTVEIGKAVSSERYATLAKEVAPPTRKKGPANPKPRKTPVE